jgi:hypothetical protein
MFATSLNYFSALVEEVAELSVREGYPSHVHHKSFDGKGLHQAVEQIRQGALALPRATG